MREEYAAWLRANSGPSVTNVAESWDSLKIAQRRDITETVIEAVVLKPPVRKGARSFDPDRLEAIWRN